MNPYPPPPLHTEYVYNKVYLFKGKGGVELTSEKARRAIVSKAGQKYQHD